MSTLYLPLKDGLYGCVGCGSILSCLELRSHTHTPAPVKVETPVAEPLPPRFKRTAAWESLMLSCKFYPWRIQPRDSAQIARLYATA